MKPHVSALVSIFVSLALPAYGQEIEKTTLLVGGTAEVRGAFPDDGPNTYAVELNPIVGYFILDNLAVGPGFVLAYSNTPDRDANAFKIGISPLVRYYVGSGSVKPFAAATIGYNYARETVDGTSTHSDFLSAGAGLGVAVFPVRSFGIDISVNYVYNPRFNEDLNGVILRIGLFGYLRPDESTD